MPEQARNLADASASAPVAASQVVIARDPHFCLLNLAQSLSALSGLCQSEGIEDRASLNGVKRGDLAALFSMCADYADAARKALPGA